ncbi:MAG TPA: DUF6361 family protein, partial [Sphingopyxis sp.]|nr:DUF6361 family protein [Sphingopyxis sp.]
MGWVWLSGRERRAAEAALADLGPDGTRDELGFGVVHFEYADRFFPGTSVQHTALRYIWFVCWVYQELAAREGGGAFPSTLRDSIEDRLGHKLLRHYGPGDGTGIIGGRVLRAGRSPVTKPSAVYWNALCNWGLVTPLSLNEAAPSRARLESAWPRLTARGAGPEVDAAEPHSLFVNPPPMPKTWRTREAIGFALDENQGEARLIRDAWRSRRDQTGRVSLLSRLADRGKPAPAKFTARSVLALCSPAEQTSLIRAERVGALAAIARAIHTHLVERMKNPAGELAGQTRRWVDEAVLAHGENALLVDLAGLRLDVPRLGTLRDLVEATQLWLAAGAGAIDGLEPLYRFREMDQRPGRALLAPEAGARRESWHPRRR